MLWIQRIVELELELELELEHDLELEAEAHRLPCAAFHLHCTARRTRLRSPELKVRLRQLKQKHPGWYMLTWSFGGAQGSVIGRMRSSVQARSS